MNTAAVISALKSYRYHFAAENGLQDGVEAVLLEIGEPFVRELVLRPVGRIDFWLPNGGLGIEIKAGSSGGGPSKVAKQLIGYASYPQVSELVIVSTRVSLRSLPDTLAGKPLHKVILWANGL